jgi:AcrR family transcriptional regulator
VSVAADTKGERTRARLLDAAVRRFAADGFRRTSVAAVARDAEVTPAAVYAYFPSKEGLFEAAVDTDAAALILETLEELEPAGGALDEAWPQLIGTLLAGLDHHPLARRVLAGHEREALPRLLGLPALADLRAVLAASLAADQEKGVVRADVDPGVLALGLESIVLSLLMSILVVGDIDPERQAGVIAVMGAALSPPPAD